MSSKNDGVVGETEGKAVVRRSLRRPSREPRSSHIKSDLQRNEILRVAAMLFAEKGYGGTKLHHIAEAANLTRTAFYYYYQNKEELLVALVEEVTYTIQRRLEGLTENDHIAPHEMLRQVVTTYSAAVMELSVEFRFLSRTEADLPPDIAVEHDLAKRKVLSSFVRVLQRGVVQGKFDVPNVKVAALGIIGMCNWTAWWFKPSGSMSIKDTAEMIGALALRIVGYSGRKAGDPEIGQEMAHLREEMQSLQRMMGQLLTTSAD